MLLPVVNILTAQVLIFQASLLCDLEEWEQSQENTKCFSHARSAEFSFEVLQNGGIDSYFS